MDMSLSPGSSPLTRGKRQSTGPSRVTSRLIPAHAGKTFQRRSFRVPSAAHPRSRGENTISLSGPSVTAGSSPLTRGKPASGSAFGQRSGLIPAHAGKTWKNSLRSIALLAHPRSRGENLSGGVPQMKWQGSSPLTRGKLNGRLEVLKTDRLIPAHAGKTRSAPPRR